MYTASQIANFFISRVNTSSGDTISHLKLQKLVYYAQAWHYTIFGQPLFDEPVEAWMHGLVIRSIYDRFHNVHIDPAISISSVELENISFPEETTALLNDVDMIYGEHSASYLEDLTHSEDPWKDTRGALPDYAYCDKEITLGSMKRYYTKKLTGVAA